MSSKKGTGIHLDVDSSILEQNLRFATDPHEEELNKIFKVPGDEYPSKLVKPFPGFCIKTREIGVDTKFFVNICQTDAIPAPNDITESELQEILESDASTFKVPMSIGEVRMENDKKGEEARVCDIAINTKFFEKIQEIQLFRNFLVAIVFEGLRNKHDIFCHDDKIILKNRKCFGNLQMHRIQQREVEQKMGQQSAPLIEEISGGQPKDIREPEYRLFRKKNEHCLTGEFKFPDVISAKDLTLDIGEDRIVLESIPKRYLLDIFIPVIIKQDACSSKFDKVTKILTVRMPLVGG